MAESVVEGAGEENDMDLLTKVLVHRLRHTTVVVAWITL